MAARARRLPRALVTRRRAEPGGEVIRARMTESKGDALIDASIRDLRTKLH
jgi:hypothetical protein